MPRCVRPKSEFLCFQALSGERRRASFGTNRGRAVKSGAFCARTRRSPRTSRDASPTARPRAAAGSAWLHRVALRFEAAARGESDLREIREARGAEHRQLAETCASLSVGPHPLLHSPLLRILPKANEPHSSLECAGVALVDAPHATPSGVAEANIPTGALQMVTMRMQRQKDRAPPLNRAPNDTALARSSKSRDMRRRVRGRSARRARR